MSDPRADRLRAGYAPIARAYREQLSDELAGKPLDRAFLAAFAERCRGPIVEVGCGPGQVAAFLASCGAQVEGTDLSPAMIDEAKALWPDLPFRVADMFALPYAAGSLAGIVAFYAIVHLRSDELAAPFAEFHRVLAPSTSTSIAPKRSPMRSARPASPSKHASTAARIPAPSTRASARTFWRAADPGDCQIVVDHSHVRDSRCGKRGHAH